MKSFFSKVIPALKVKRTPVALCDCSDYVTAVPDAPTLGYLRDVVSTRHFGSMPPPESDIEKDQRAHIVKCTVFDLKYRCGAEGRCTCSGAPACRFPSCFTLRPITKGAEIMAERQAYEVDDAPTPAIRALVVLAKEEKLEETVKGIQYLADEELHKAAAGRKLDAVFIKEGSPEDEFAPGAAKLGEESAHNGINPLRENESLREEVTSLYLWRAALLVNLRRDEEAVNSLLNLSMTVEQQHRTRLYAAAVTWACLNDMEVIYYRSLTQQYEPFDLANHFANDRPMLLARVFEAMKADEYHTQYCTHVVFSKEVTAAVSRAQSAQANGDLSEDPMRSLCLPFSIPYYRFKISDAFWKHFFDLLCMPPVPPPSESEEKHHGMDPAELGLTPNYILDAVGRSMMLHHLVLFADTRQKEIDTGAVVDRVKIKQQRGETVYPSDYNPVLDARDMSVAIARMRQLLVVTQSFEEEERARLRGSGPGSSSSQLPPRSNP